MSLVREKKQRRDLFDGETCTKIGLWVNILLTVVKLSAGIFGYSKAMLADSLNSALDVLATGIVLVGLRISRKPADDNHPYGHGNADTIASFLVALILLLTGLYIGYSAIHVLIHGHISKPGRIALYAAVFSIVVKETLFHYTMKVGRRLNSQAIIANAWDHRTDVYSSSAALIGIFVARSGIPVFDPIAGFAITVMIFWIAFRLVHASVDIIMDESPDKGTLQQISKVTSGVAGVVRVDEVRVHQRGPDRSADVKIEVDGENTVNAGHAIATEVKAALIESDLRIVDAMVHVNPAVEDEP
ncbi:cation diffusion facilitator family transporter [Candidatus Poribacteria bacterium]